jgi:hypothetical protein
MIPDRLQFVTRVAVQSVKHCCQEVLLPIYWPRTRTLLCKNCGEPEYRSFFSSAADEDIYAGRGNPF